MTNGRRKTPRVSNNEDASSDRLGNRRCDLAHIVWCFVGDNRVIFNIGGNKYRLVVHVYYPHRIVRTKFVGTHGQYDRINPETVEP